MNKWTAILWGMLLFSCGNDNTTQKQRFLIRGNEALRQQNYREARRFYNEAINLDSCYSPAINNLGIVLFEQGAYGQAVLQYERAMICDPGYMDAYINRANAFYELKEFYRSLDDLQYVERELPDSAAVHFMKGLVFTQMRKYDDAIIAFDRAIQLDSLNAESWINRGTVYYYLTDYQKAQADLDKALLLDTFEPNAYNALALVEVERGNYDQALAFVNKALDFEPGQPYFLNNRGFIYLLQGEHGQARADIDRSITVDPTNAWAYRNKGWYYFHQGEYTEAIRLLRQALKMDPYIDRGHLFLAKAYFANGQQTEACEELKASSYPAPDLPC